MIALVVAAHPDDEVLGCGGTIASLSAANHDVHVCILGEGVTSRAPRRDLADAAGVATLRDQALAAAELLGVRSVELHGLPDNRFDTVPLLDVIKIVEQHIERAGPEFVYTHHRGDLNIDHRVTHDAVLAATRPLQGQTVVEVHAWESPSSTEWSFGRDSFSPNVFVDISSTLDRKIEAMGAYRGEIRQFPHPRSPEALRASAHRWGSVAGLEAAEAFELIRAIRTGWLAH